MHTFGQRLAQLRQQKGLSQEEFAVVFKVSKSRIGMYETDQREPDFDMLIQFADYFQVTLDYLIRGK